MRAFLCYEVDREIVRAVSLLGTQVVNFMPWGYYCEYSLSQGTHMDQKPWQYILAEKKHGARFWEKPTRTVGDFWEKDDIIWTPTLSLQSQTLVT